MRGSCIASLIAVGAVSLPLLAGTPSAVAASAGATSPIGTQLAELKGSATVSDDGFGCAVAISGPTAFIGAVPVGGGADRVYVFDETTAGWKQVADLRASDAVANDGFGGALAISGTTVVIGAVPFVGLGRAYVFTETATGWKQVAELKGAGTIANDFFGNSVAISGTTALVGARGTRSGAGVAYVFTKTGDSWKQVAKLKVSETIHGDTILGYDFGSSVAISGSTAVVGSVNRAYVFTRAVSGWKQVAELKGSDTVTGDGSFEGSAADGFGEEVAISGTTVIVGAWAAPHVSGAGRTYVFTKIGDTWKQVAELNGSLLGPSRSQAALPAGHRSDAEGAPPDRS